MRFSFVFATALVATAAPALAYPTTTYTNTDAAPAADAQDDSGALNLVASLGLLSQLVDGDSDASQQQKRALAELLTRSEGAYDLRARGLLARQGVTNESGALSLGNIGNAILQIFGGKKKGSHGASGSTRHRRADDFDFEQLAQALSNPDVFQTLNARQAVTTPDSDESDALSLGGIGRAILRIFGKKKGGQGASSTTGGGSQAPFRRADDLDDVTHVLTNPAFFDFVNGVGHVARRELEAREPGVFQRQGVADESDALSLGNIGNAILQIFGGKKKGSHGASGSTRHRRADDLDAVTHVLLNPDFFHFINGVGHAARRELEAREPDVFERQDATDESGALSLGNIGNAILQIFGGKKKGSHGASGSTRHRRADDVDFEQLTEVLSNPAFVNFASGVGHAVRRELEAREPGIFQTLENLLIGLH
ncbi:hypothetical protein BDW22DRAFT_1058962 [Trametopsis cervina]|nr:hypothetical protein BDW22DRAFT_1058962 [Trametopsis cervina]